MSLAINPEESWPKTKVVFMDQAGPLLLYGPGVFCIKDLNPENHIHWRMSRWDLFMVGLRCIKASLSK